MQKSVSGSFISYLSIALWTTVGAFLAALAIVYFLTPHNLIDGGIVGVAMIISSFVGENYLPYFLILFNIPFILLGYKLISKSFVVQMFYAVFAFAGFCFIFHHLDHPLINTASFDMLEVVITAGVILGGGIGLIIRMGGSLDGTEIMAIIINRTRGHTVGRVVLFFNIFIFAAAAVVFRDWHIAFQSLLVYFVAMKVMDAVIVGLEETKSVTIISSQPKKISEVIINELGLGLTIIHGQGGYSGEKKELLYIIVERLQLAKLKEVVQREDPLAYIAIENLHEVINTKNGGVPSKKKK
jgi:uncharacterized membrane-anchored protein YitT (DUF2179 family)